MCFIYICLFIYLFLYFKKILRGTATSLAALAIANPSITAGNGPDGLWGRKWKHRIFNDKLNPLHFSHAFTVVFVASVRASAASERLAVQRELDARLFERRTVADDARKAHHVHAARGAAIVRAVRRGGASRAAHRGDHRRGHREGHGRLGAALRRV